MKKSCKLLPKMSGLKEYPGGGSVMKSFMYQAGGSTPKFDNNPKLIGKQSNLPDSIQSKIINAKSK